MSIECICWAGEHFIMYSLTAANSRTTKDNIFSDHTQLAHSQPKSIEKNPPTLPTNPQKYMKIKQ